MHFVYLVDNNLHRVKQKLEKQTLFAIHWKLNIMKLVFKKLNRLLGQKAWELSLEGYKH